MLAFNTHSAVGATLGYFYQCRYALWLFLKQIQIRTDVDLALERADDITLSVQDDLIEVVQTKRHGRAASLGDTSEDLWKSIRVWSEGILSGSLDPQRMTFSLVTTLTASPGSAAILLHPLASRRDPTQATTLLRKAAKTSTSKSLKTSFQAFESLTAGQQQDLITALFVLDASPDFDMIERGIIGQLRLAVDEPFIPAALKQLTGWWDDMVIHHLLAAEHHVISGELLFDYLRHLRHQFRTDSLPLYDDVDEAPSAFIEASKDKLFAEQLNLIGARPRALARAIHDFYRAYELYSRWTRDHLLPARQRDEYRRMLLEEWERAFEHACDAGQSNLAAEERQQLGRDLFHKIEDLHLPIRPHRPERFISRGSYHMLADQGLVGWHPEYESLLAEMIRLARGTQ